MKKLFIAIVLPLLLLSCGKFEEVNFGYPTDIKFTEDGGERVISVEGVQLFYHIVVIDYKTAGEGMYYPNDGEGGYCEYEWLRVESEACPGSKFKVVAQPNDTGKSRKLWIELISGYKYHVIQVVQD